MTDKIKDVLAELRSGFDALYGERLERLVLFGSQARGDADTDSDIDVLVVLREKVNPGEEIARTGATLTALSLKYDAVVSCTFISTVRFVTEESPLLLNIRREGVPV